MATTTTPGTAHEPRIALGVALRGTRPGLATIVAVAANPQRPDRADRRRGRLPPPYVPDAHLGPIRALAVVEHAGEPLVISTGSDRALRNWRLNGWLPGAAELCLGRSARCEPIGSSGLRRLKHERLS
jgi:hypothetical protein